MSLVAPTGDLHLKSVLIATDFSDASDKAMRHGLAIARHYGARLYLVHVVSSLGFTLAGPGAINEAAEVVRRDARQLQDRLTQSGALAGVRHEAIVLQGDVCETLERVIRQENVELVVIGTHARRGLGKLLLGSVAEQIFLRTECLVLTVGPGSLRDSPVGSKRPIRPFVFATSFSEASLHALPYAISAANHFGTRLVLLHVAPAITMPEGVGRPTADDVAQAREKSHAACIRQLTELTLHAPKLAIEPEFLVEFGSPSEKILQAANDLKADAMILGLHRSTHISTAAHMPWATAYEVVCGACCSVLTVRN
jgi:nucleotide-binding universal stress UspA family protein